MKQSPIRARILPLALAAALATSLAVGCTGTDQIASVQNVGMICGIGSTATVERFAGVVETKAETKIEKDGAFTVAEILVEVGDAVEEGQVLFVYDKDRTALELEKAELDLQMAKTTVEEKKANIEQLKQERERVGSSAKLGYTLQIQQLEVEITEAEFTIEAQEKELVEQRKLLENLEVTAPVSGSVRSINTTGQTDNYGNPLPYMVITELGDFRVKGYVNEANRVALYEGMGVLVRSRVDSTVQRGTLKTIDLSNPQSSQSTMYYYGDVDDTQTSNKYPFYVELDSSEGFILGQHVYIEPDYGQAATADETLVLPAYYITDADSKPWVWAEGKNGKLEKRTLELGEYDELMDAYVVLSGLTAKDYIAFPEEGLKSGMACTEYDGYIPGDDVMYLDGGVYLAEGEFVATYDEELYDDYAYEGVVVPEAGVETTETTETTETAETAETTEAFAASSAMSADVA